MGTGEQRAKGPARFWAIVLAAGSGRRFGGAKLTTPWRGGCLIDGALEAAFSAPVERVIVATGADPAVGAACRTFAARMGRADDLELVHIADHAEGMGASLRGAAARLPAGLDGAFVFLGDMPATPRGLAKDLAAALDAGAVAAAPSHRGRRGHPVLFGASLLTALATSQGDEGARQILLGLASGLALVETNEPGVLVDVDRPEDLPD